MYTMHFKTFFVAIVVASLSIAATAHQYAAPKDVSPSDTFQLVAFSPSDDEVTWKEYWDLLMQEDKSAPWIHTFHNDTLRLTRTQSGATRWRFDAKTGSVYAYMLGRPYAISLGGPARYPFLKSRHYARIALSYGIGSGTPFYFMQVEENKNVLRYKGASKSRLTMCREHAKDTAMVLVRRPLSESKLRYCEDVDFQAVKVDPKKPFDAGNEFPPLLLPGHKGY